VNKFNVATDRRNQFLDVTDIVRSAVRGVARGMAVVYCPHTTAAVTVQENADPDVVHDLLLWLDRHIPQHLPGFRHAEGNSDSHLKAALVGPSVTLIVEGGELVLGRWQGIYFCEFDGPRRRELCVQVLASGPV
jgi:secondary thiamine-phosphate synthase enzyme